MNEDQAREKIEEMQRLNSNPLIFNLKRPKMAATTTEQKLAELQEKYEKLKKIMVNCLIAIDVLLKFGTPVALFFWAVPQNNLMQSIGLACYVILLTIISKTITRIKTHDQE